MLASTPQSLNFATSDLKTLLWDLGSYSGLRFGGIGPRQLCTSIVEEVENKMERFRFWRGRGT